MSQFERIPSDDPDAPENYAVRVALEDPQPGDRFIYFENITRLANSLNCSRVKAKNLIDGRRTIKFTEYFSMNLKS